LPNKLFLLNFAFLPFGFPHADLYPRAVTSDAASGAGCCGYSAAIAFRQRESVRAIQLMKKIGSGMSPLPMPISSNLDGQALPSPRPNKTMSEILQSVSAFADFDTVNSMLFEHLDNVLSASNPRQNRRNRLRSNGHG